MTRDKQRLVDYLGHILEAIERIDRYMTNRAPLEPLNRGLMEPAKSWKFQGGYGNRLENDSS
jgi:hypothetical protein